MCHYYILALSCIYPAEDRAKYFLQSVGNVYEIGSILQISYNKEILLFAQCLWFSLVKYCHLCSNKSR